MEKYDETEAQYFGEIIDAGPSPYNYDKDEKQSYFITIKNRKNENQTIWGVDLKRALIESGLKAGQFVSIKNIGKQPVEVEKILKDENGLVIGSEKIQTMRNEWVIKEDNKQSIDNSAQKINEQSIDNSTQNINKPNLNSYSMSQEPIFDKSDIKDLLFSLQVTSDESLIDRLAAGHESPLLQDVFINNEYQDGKLKLFMDKGVLKFKFNSKQQKLTIPDKILDHKLTPEEKQDLENNKTVLIKSNKSVIALAVDKELNKVVVKGDNQLGLLKELGGYKFSVKEQQALLNGEAVGPKVFYDDKEKRYIQASVSFTEDGKGIKFSGIKEVDNSKAQELINKFNLHKNEISSVTNIASKSIEQAEKKAFELKDFEIAIGNRDYQKLENLKSQSQISNENIQHLFGTDAYKSLTRAEQIAIDKILNSSPQQAKEVATPGELETANSAAKSLETTKADQTLNNSDPKFKELIDAIHNKDFSSLEKMQTSPEILQKVFQSQEYLKLSKEDQFGVQIALQSNPKEVESKLISNEVQKALEGNNHSKIQELAESNKLSNTHISQIQEFVKSKGENIDPEIKESLGKTVESVKQDLSPNTKNITISKTKSIGI